MKTKKLYNESLNLKRQRKDLYNSVDSDLKMLVTPLLHRDSVSRLNEAMSKYRDREKIKKMNNSLNSSIDHNNSIDSILESS